MPESIMPLLAVGVVAVLFILLVSLLSNNDSLNGIKSKTVGDGQHGTARWATAQEIRKSYASVPFDAPSWRAGKNLPEVQGLILGSTQRGKQLEALVDSDDVHCLMIGASGVGKTAFFLYPNLEFACASGMSYVALDTKGDLSRNYGTIAKKILRLSRFRDRSSQPDALGWEQSPDAHQSLHGHCKRTAGQFSRPRESGKIRKDPRQDHCEPRRGRAGSRAECVLL